MLKLKNLVVFFAFVLTMFGFSINFNEVRVDQELSYTTEQIVAVVDNTSSTSTFNINFEDNQEVDIALATSTFMVDFETSNVVVENEKAIAKAEVVERAHAPPTFEIGFTFKKAEARDRIFRDIDRASRRVADRTRDRIVRDTEHNIQRRINDHIRDQAELLDPSSRTYQEFKCKNLINSLPYGVTRVLVQGSIDSAHAPGCVFLERQHMRLLERIIRDYSNVVIANDCYKMARNGRRGEWIGYDIQKVYDANEIIVTDEEPVRRRR